MEVGLGEIRISLDILIAEDLTVQQFVFCYFLYKNEIENAYSFTLLSTEEVEELENKLFIDILNDTRNQEIHGRIITLNQPDVILTEAGKALFEESDLEKKFEEFWNTFPRSVPDGNGSTRVLRSIKLDTHDAEACKKKYLKIIKNEKGLHDRIIKALKTQLYIERHKIQYINAPEVWLNKRIFEKFLDVKTELDSVERYTRG